MDELSIFSKDPANSQKNSDLSQINHMVELFQNSLHQQKVHIAYEVRAVLFEELSSSFQNSFSSALENINHANKASLTTLERKIDERLKNIEERLSKLEYESWYIKQFQTKTEENFNKQDQQIQELSINWSSMTQMIWKANEDNKKLEEMQEKLNENIISIHRDLRSVSEIVKTKKDNLDDIKDLQKELYELKVEVFNKFLIENEKNYEKYMKIGTDFDSIKAKIWSIERNSRESDNLSESIKSLKVRDESQLVLVLKDQFSDDIKKINETIRNLESEVYDLSMAELKNKKIRQKVGV